MNIGVLGTGMVGQALAGKLDELGHKVIIGTRDVEATRVRREPDDYGNPGFAVWHENYADVVLATYFEAAERSELLVNATSGKVSEQVLRAAGPDNLEGKIVIDISNPLDFSGGFPPTLSLCNTDSVGELLQRKFPGCRIVKTLNTISAPVMVQPGALAGGEHTVFLSGNDPVAKSTVRSLLESFGHKDILDLGDISTARGSEMYLALWTRLYGAIQKPMFSIKVVR